MYCQYLTMGTTLTIPNLEEAVKQKLRLKAARHNTSMKAEARTVLAGGLAGRSDTEKETARTGRQKGIESVVRIWKDN